MPPFEINEQRCMHAYKTRYGTCAIGGANKVYKREDCTIMRRYEYSCDFLLSVSYLSARPAPVTWVNYSTNCYLHGISLENL